MSLRFILGPAGAGKTHLCVHELAAMIDADALGSPLLFIVPQQATFINERLLAETLCGWWLLPGRGYLLFPSDSPGR